MDHMPALGCSDKGHAGHILYIFESGNTEWDSFLK